MIGKPIPAGTGNKRYRNIALTYRGKKVDDISFITSLPDWSPDELREVESMLPQSQSWSIDGEVYLGSMGSSYGSYTPAASMGGSKTLPSEMAKLYIYDDLGVSQRWANKFAEAGIETVGDLIGRSEDDLLRIEGIGAKAIVELKEGLEKYDLLYLLDSDGEQSEPDIDQLLSMVFAPDDSLLYGDDMPLMYSADPDEDEEDFTLPAIRRMNDDAALDELLIGFGDGASISKPAQDDFDLEDDEDF